MNLGNEGFESADFRDTGSAGRNMTDLDTGIRVFLSLENRLLREAMARSLRKCDDILVVGSSKKEDCTAQIIAEAGCHVLVLDFLDPDWLGRTLGPDHGATSLPRCLLIGMSGEFEEFLAAIQAGVTGYLLKDASSSEVLAAVRSTSHGGAVCPPELCGFLFQYVSERANPGRAPAVVARPSLTLRQQRLTTLVAKGLTNKEIASRLNLSEYTVRNHIYRIMKRVAARSRRQAVETILSQGYSLTLDRFG